MATDFLLCGLVALIGIAIGFFAGKKRYEKSIDKKSQVENETPRPLAASESFKELQKVIDSNSGNPAIAIDDKLREWLRN